MTLLPLQNSCSFKPSCWVNHPCIFIQSIFSIPYQTPPYSSPLNNTSHHINFQLYPASQLHIWLRGTPNAMVPMGEGEWVSRDNDPQTGERLWSGTLVDGDTYYLRVFNNSDQVVDYYVMNQDVVNTELGERVFAANQYYPYVLYPAGSSAARNNR